MKKKKVVIALGHAALGTTLPQQKIATQKTAKTIADIIEEGYQVVITHSNAPQVGMIHTAMNDFHKRYPEYSPSPMSVCSAMSQGYIGYDLQNSIRTELLRRGIFKTVSTVLTQVAVDPYDEAFYKPIKVVGRRLTAEEAKSEEDKGNYVIENEDGFHRIVAAPKPQEIIEIDAIRLLLEGSQVVIAAGGGGIPVLEQGFGLKGASAVIEKDLISEKLADDVNADILLILTGVEQIYLNYKTDSQTPLNTISALEAESYIESGQFESGSILPKMEAGVRFVKGSKNRMAVITSLEKGLDGLREKAGTIIKE